MLHWVGVPSCCHAASHHVEEDSSTMLPVQELVGIVAAACGTELEKNFPAKIEDGSPESAMGLSSGEPGFPCPCFLPPACTLFLWAVLLLLPILFQPAHPASCLYPHPSCLVPGHGKKGKLNLDMEPHQSSTKMT